MLEVLKLFVETQIYAFLQFVVDVKNIGCNGSVHLAVPFRCVDCLHRPYPSIKCTPQRVIRWGQVKWLRRPKPPRNDEMSSKMSIIKFTFTDMWVWVVCAVLPSCWNQAHLHCTPQRVIWWGQVSWLRRLEVSRIMKLLKMFVIKFTSMWVWMVCAVLQSWNQALAQQCPPHSDFLGRAPESRCSTILHIWFSHVRSVKLCCILIFTP